MSQNNPYIFSAGGGSVPPAQTPNLYQRGSSTLQQPTAAMQQNVQLPGIDMSALEGISPEQLAAIARLFQSGALQMPPPAAAAAAHTSSMTQSAPAPPQSHANQRQGAEVSMSITPQLEVDMDTEEGEVDESEPNNTPGRTRDFLRPPPTGPKNRSLSPHQRLQKQNKRSASPRPTPRKPAAALSSPQSDRRTSRTLTERNGTRTVAKDEAAKMFVLEMVRAGFSYNDIAREVRNSKALMRMFKDLALPLSSVESTEQHSQPNGLAGVHPRMSTTQEEASKTTSTKRPTSEKPAPIDRNAYLARLQAAKNKKADAASPADVLALAPQSATDSTTQPAPVKRNDYLARLQAAKNKKAEVPTAPSPPSLLESKAQPEDSTLGSVQDSTSAPNHAIDVAPTLKAHALAGGGNKAASLTELARKRLLALQASRQNPAAATGLISKELPATDDARLDPMEDGLGAGLANISALLSQKPPQPLAPASTTTALSLPQPQAQAQQQLPSLPQTPSRSFGNLPGLFMFGSTAQSHTPSSSPQVASDPRSGVPILSSSALQQPQTRVLSSNLPDNSTARKESPAEPVLSRKRAVASDFDNPPIKPASAKRPFGQSRNASEDESLVIQVSDDDEEDDTEIEVLPASIPESGGRTKSFRDVGPLRDFPVKPNFQTQNSTPGTPGGIAYEQKMKEIEEFKRQIAEREKKQKPNGKAVVSPNQPSTPSNQTIPAQRMLPVQAAAQAEPMASDSSPVASESRPLSAAQVARQQEKERLRSRLLELQRQVVKDHHQSDKGAELGAEQINTITEITREEPLYAGSKDIEAEHADVNVSYRVTDVQDSKSEDGELSDDSMSGIYEVEDDEVDEHQTVVDVVDDADEVVQLDGSSPIAQDERASSVLGLDPPQADSLKQAHNTLEGSSSTPTMASAVERQASQQQIEDVDHGSTIQEGLQDTAEHHTAAFAPLPHIDVTLGEVTSDNPDHMEEDLQHDDSLQGIDVSVGDTMAAHTAEADLDDSGSVSTTSSSDREEAEPARDQLISDTVDLTNDEEADDGLAPELQPTQEVQTMTPDQDPSQTKSYFSPYRSPLQGFKDYRYHPEFLSTVAGGYKSTTYSHHIDAQNPFCPFETTGGKCNDNTCEYQHFKSLIVSDNELLKAMGTKDIPAHGPNELKRWNEGLGNVVRELKTSNTKGADAIAARIAQYRRDFVGDPTKTLHLS